MKKVQKNHYFVNGRKVVKRKTRGLKRSQEKMEKKKKIINHNTLVIAMDLSLEEICTVAMSPRNKQPITSFSVPFDKDGFEGLIETAKELKEHYNFKHVVFAMEPTSHYWIILAEHLKAARQKYVLVQPISVWRERQSEHYSYAKTDYEDAQLIGYLAIDMKFTFTQLPQTPLWASMEALASEWILLNKKKSAEAMRLKAFWHRIVPEFLDIFKEQAGNTAIALSKALLPLPQIRKIKLEEFIGRIRNYLNKKRLMVFKVKVLYEIIRNDKSFGSRLYEGGLTYSISHAAKRYELYNTQQQEAEERLLKLYKQTGYDQFLDSIPSVNPVKNALTLSFIGDPCNYDCPRCLPKLAGTNACQNTSGRHSGKTPITHWGNGHLSYLTYLIGFSLKTHNPEFKMRFNYLINRAKNPLKESQAIVACGNKYLRMVHVLCTQKVCYNMAMANGIF